MEHIEAGSFTSSNPTEEPSAFRVVSWNIARGSKLNAVIEFLAAAKSDIIFLQEADKNARRTGNQNIAKEIAQKLRLNYVFGNEFEELAQGSASSPAYHGQATLSRWPLLNSSILRFHKQSNFWGPRWFIPSLPYLQRRRGGRMALFTQALTPGGAVATYNLHLESKGGDEIRYSQLQELLREVNHHFPDMPVLAAGDFNFALSRGEAAAALANVGIVNPFATFQEATTPPHLLSARGRVIDCILLRGPLNGTDAHVHSSVLASDHYPLSLSVSFCGCRVVEHRVIERLHV